MKKIMYFILSLIFIFENGIAQEIEKQAVELAKLLQVSLEGM